MVMIVYFMLYAFTQLNLRKIKNDLLPGKYFDVK